MELRVGLAMVISRAVRAFAVERKGRPCFPVGGRSSIVGMRACVGLINVLFLSFRRCWLCSKVRAPRNVLRIPKRPNESANDQYIFVSTVDHALHLTTIGRCLVLCFTDSTALLQGPGHPRCRFSPLWGLQWFRAKLLLGRSRSRSPINCLRTKMGYKDSACANVSRCILVNVLAIALLRTLIFFCSC